MKNKCRSLKGSKLCITILTLVLVVLFSFPALSWSRPKTINRETYLHDAQKRYDQKVHLRNPGDLTFTQKPLFYTPLKSKSPYSILTRNYRDRSRNYRDRYNRLSPEEKNMLKERYREWESLPKQERQKLRHRMNRYKRLPPKDRERYQHRYHQWQKLTPDERYRIREKLQKWNRLSPEEKEQIRQRFRGQ
jgi:hypothetical protein